MLLLVALSAVWLARLGRGDQQLYDIYFRQSVDGLARGSEVSYAGVPAGQIKQIELWKKDPGFVRVRVAIDERIPILAGTTATIQGSFTGVSTIQLNGGVKGAPEISQPGPDGVAVIPTKRSGLGELLSNAPMLLDRLSTLTEKLTNVLSDQNQKSVTNILANADRLTRNLADASPQVKSTLAELQLTLQQATQTLAEFQKVAGTANKALDDNGPSRARQLHDTLKSAQAAADSLQALANDARPATRKLSETTLPEAEAAIRDLRATSRALRDVTEKIDNQGVGAVLGKPKLPDYKP